jgi:hypothetical protein
MYLPYTLMIISGIPMPHGSHNPQRVFSAGEGDGETDVLFTSFITGMSRMARLLNRCRLAHEMNRSKCVALRSEKAISPKNGAR